MAFTLIKESTLLASLSGITREPAMKPPRTGYVAIETEDDLCGELDLPGIGESDVKVCAEGRKIVIKAKYPNTEEDEEGITRGIKFTGLMCTQHGLQTFDEKEYNIDKMKYKMKNGVLKITVPKVKAD